MMTMPAIEANVQLAQSPSAGEIWATAAAAPWPAWLETWLAKLPPDQLPTILTTASEWELTVRLTGDAEIAALNSQYRQKPEPTDVLAFAALEADLPAAWPTAEAAMSIYLGDIVISVETAEQQALEQGHSLMIELAWLASHGLLHLLGWDHPDAASLSQMLDQQRSLLQAVGLLLPQTAPGSLTICTDFPPEPENFSDICTFA